MASRLKVKRQRQIFLLNLIVGILAIILLSLSLSACNVVVNCSGINVVCNNGTVTSLTPDATAQAQAVATANAILQSKPFGGNK